MLIVKLGPNKIFIFGANLAGRHGAGAALQARLHFGAKNGVGEGLTGQSYAFPTLDENLCHLTPERLTAARELLYICCTKHPDKRFLLTKVGCGLAGYPEATMRAMFVEHPINLILPEDWE